MYLSITNYEILYSNYLFSFEQIKKNSNKNDQNYSKILEICNLLNESKNVLNDENQLEKISLILVQPLNICKSKIIEIIINVFDEIIKYNLVNSSIFEKMTKGLLIYIYKYLESNEINLKLYQSIMHIFKSLINKKFDLIENNNILHFIMGICIKIHLFQNEKNNYTVYDIFIFFVDKFLHNMSNSKISLYTNNEYNYNYLCEINKQNNNINNDKNDLKKIAQITSFLFFSKKYMDFLIDIIEIQSKITNNNKENNIIEKYINIIKRINDPSNKETNEQNQISFKDELESLNLNQLDLYNNIKNDDEKCTKYKIGKYGWCILCRKTSNYWSHLLNFPICDNNHSCEKDLYNYISKLYSKNNIINMLLFFSKTSISKSVNIKTTELCLQIIRHILKKGSGFFKNDIDIIIIIKEIFKESILKNAMSQNVKIFELSLDIFSIIFKYFKYYLKEQIETFFMKVIINFLESESRGFNYKEIIIDNLSTLIDDSNFLLEIYINYDCDTNRPAIFCVFINLLTKIMNGLFEKIKYKNTFKNSQENNIIIKKTFNFLNKFIWYLNELMDKNVTNEKIKEISDNDEKITIDNINNNNIEENDEKNNNKIKKIIEEAIQKFNYGKSIDECLLYLQSAKIIFSEESFNKLKTAYIDDYNNNIIKEDYSPIFTKEENSTINELNKYYQSILKDKNIQDKNEKILNSNNYNNLLFFITNEKKINLPEIEYTSYTSFEISTFIRTNIKFLSKQKIKKYLYDYNNPFNLKVLYYYISNFNFKNKDILNSLRMLLEELPFTTDEKIIDIIIKIFVEKFYEQNQIELDNIDDYYYLCFFVIHICQNENIKKYKKEEFIEKFNSFVYGNKIDEKILESYYNQIINEPLLFLKNENKSELNLDTPKVELNNFITNIDNNTIKKLIDFSCGNFLAIYSQTLNESIINNNKNLFLVSIEKIFYLSKICGILKIAGGQEECNNTIITMINLNEKDELNENMIEIIIKFMNYINNNCQYILTGWMNILQLISNLEYYLLEQEETIITNMKNTKPIKFTDKEIKFFLNKKSTLALNISDAVCEAIFSKTELFDNQSIIYFVSDLCEISKKELSSNYIPRLFSLYKLKEVADFNIFRIQYIWNKIWKKISEYLIDIIINNQQENIWKQSLDSLNQTVCKLLHKEENLIYNFQMEYFIPFETIFYKTNKMPERGEIIIDYINSIVSQYWKNIHSGWTIIFRLLRNAYQRKSSKINENIKNILKIIYNYTNILLENNINIFKEFMELLCFFYIDKQMKQIAFEIIVGILSKIGNKDENNNPQILMKLPKSNKIYEYIKIFFYSIDNDLMKLNNSIEYYNILFEIINHNKKLLLSEELNTFMYMFFIYLKTHIVILLFSHYNNIASLFNYQQQKESNENIIYSQLTNDNILENVNRYFEQYFEYLINDLSQKESKEHDKMFYINDKRDEHKLRAVGFLKEIKEMYIKGEMANYMINKINKLYYLDESNYELSIKYFLEKFKNMFCKNKDENNNNKYINYNYFYIDLLLLIQKLAILNNNADLIYRTLYKIISLSMNELTKENSYKLIKNNILILEIISLSDKNFTTEEDIYKFIKYSLFFSNYLLDFIQLFQNNFIEIYKLISKLFNKILLIDLNNNFEKYKIVNSNTTIVLLLKLQDIQLYILSKINDYKEIKNIDDINKIINLNKIYNKYQIEKEENSLINKVFIVELENILPKYIIILNNNEIEIIYECLTNLICSANHNIRKGAKNILKSFIHMNLISVNNTHVK